MRNSGRNPEARKARRAVIAKGVIGQKTTPQIASELGISRVQVWNELQQPETQELIQSWFRPHHARLRAIVDRQIAQVERALTIDESSRLGRIEALTDRITRLRQVIAERAARYSEAEENGQDRDFTHATVPGMKTGTMVHREKVIGGGENARVTDEYEVDTGLLKELREHEKQLRDELNDFTPNLKAVERARDLLELAEGTRKDGDSNGKPLRWSGELTELLAIYATIQPKA